MDLNDAQQSLLNTMAQSNSFALFQIIVFKSGHALLNNIKRLFFLDKVENRYKQVICS